MSSYNLSKLISHATLIALVQFVPFRSVLLTIVAMESGQSFSTISINSSGKRKQIFASFVANLGGFALGTVLSWTSPALPSLRQDSSFGNITITEESWIGSIVPLGACIGGPIAGFCTDVLGRRATMLLLTVPFLLGWIGIYLAQNITTIICSRFITGICGGAFSVLSPIYVGEVSDASIRGYLGAGFELLVCIGILFTNIIGEYLPWRLQALTAALVPATIFVLLLCVPEAPRYLLSVNKRSEAEKALRWFNGHPARGYVQKELEQLEEDIARTKANQKSINHGNSSQFLQLFSSPAIKPFSIGLFLVMINEASGIDVVTFYTVDLFQSAGVSIDSYASTIMLGIVQIIAAAITAIIVDKYGRRFLLLFSEIFVALSLLSFTAFFIIRQLNPEFALSYLQYLPLISLIVYVFAYVIGLGTIIYMIMGEILPQHVKGLASGLITILKWMLGFGITKSFNSLVISMGEIGVFGLFTGFSAAGFIYTYFCLPETSGKTLEEIQDTFKTKYNTLQGIDERNVLLKAEESQHNFSNDSAFHSYDDENDIGYAIPNYGAI